MGRVFPFLSILHIPPQLSRPQAARSLAVLFVASSFARFLLSKCIGGPTIFTDELNYVEFGRTALAWKGMAWGDLPVDFPCWVYPLIIAPFLTLLPMKTAYPCILALNALLMSATPILSYRLARLTNNRRLALGAAGLTALLPALGYSGKVMVENLFLPAFVAAMLLAVRAIERPTVGCCLSAGIVFGLTFHVKPQGLFIPAIFALSVFWIETERLLKNQEGSRGNWKAFFTNARHHVLTALGWLIGISPRFLETTLIRHSISSISPSAFVGSYGSLVGFPGKKIELGSLLLVFLGNVGVWTLGTGFFSAGSLIRALLPVRNATAMTRRRILAILTAVASVLILLLIARHTLLADQEWHLHERYFMVVFPMALTLFLADKPSKTDSMRLPVLGLGTVVAVGLILTVITGSIAMGSIYSLPSDSPTLTGLLMFFSPHLLPMGWVIVLGVTMTFSLGLTTAAVRFVRVRPWSVAALLICLNLGWYGTHHFLLKPWAKEDRKIAGQIQSKIDPKDKVLILHDGLKTSTLFNAAFYNPNMALHLNPSNRLWFGHPLALADEGAIISPFPSDKSWFLAGANWKFNKEPVKNFKTCALYQVGGDPPLRIEKEMVEEHLSQKKPVEIAQAKPGAESKKLPLAFASKEFPKYWNAGKTAKVSLVVRNEGTSPLSVKGGKLAVGYHWSDPERTGKWDAVIWDDGHHTVLPDALAPGHSFMFDLEVKAPDQPGDRWLLSILPLTVNGAQNSWNIESKPLDEYVRVIPVGQTVAEAPASKSEATLMTSGKSGKTKKPAASDQANPKTSSKTAPPPTDEEVERLTKKVKLAFLDMSYPTWEAGKIEKVNVLLRNDSTALFLKKPARLALGYHWSDPERTGSWDAVVWDDGHCALLPETLAPGDELAVSIEVLAPAKPGDRWLLGISPMIAIGDKHYWVAGAEQLNEYLKVLPAGSASTPAKKIEPKPTKTPTPAPTKRETPPPANPPKVASSGPHWDIAKDMKLTFLSQSYPTTFQSGKTASVSLTLRNDASVALPGGNQRLAIGYHWSDPERTGKWDAVVWDDNHFALLPENLAKGKTCKVDLTVAVPSPPGEKWLLTLSPVLIEGDQHLWDPVAKHPDKWIKVVP